MNILISSAHYHLSDKYGSEAKWGLDIINEYLNLGHTVCAIAGCYETDSPIESSRLKLKYISKKRNDNPLVEAIVKSIYPLYSFFQCAIFLNKKKFDIVHHIAPSSVVSYDLLFIFKYLFAQSSYIYGPILIPPLETDHKSIGRVLGNTKSLLLPLISLAIKITTPALNALFKKTIKNSDHVVVPTLESKDYYQTLFPNKKVSLIPIGIKAQPKVEKNKKTKILNILTVSYLTSRKGIDILINTFSKIIKDNLSIGIQLTIVGSGEEESRLKNLTKDLKIEKYVVFTGFIPHEKISHFYKNSDLFCTPTRYEPYGMSILEAMSYGLPVIASDVNSTKELIGDSGIVFRKDDEHDLYMKMKHLILDDLQRERMSKSAYKKAILLYNWKTIAKKYLNLKYEK